MAADTTELAKAPVALDLQPGQHFAVPLQVAVEAGIDGDQRTFESGDRIGKIGGRQAIRIGQGEFPDERPILAEPGQHIAPVAAHLDRIMDRTGRLLFEAGSTSIPEQDEAQATVEYRRRIDAADCATDAQRKAPAIGTAALVVVAGGAGHRIVARQALVFEQAPPQRNPLSRQVRNLQRQDRPGRVQIGQRNAARRPHRQFGGDLPRRAIPDDAPQTGKQQYGEQ